MLKAAIGHVHERAVFDRRVGAIAQTVAPLLEPGARLLDVGTGDGRIAALIAACSEQVHVEGIDVMLRPATEIDVKLFDGETIPFRDNSFDTVSFVDVLHHTDNPVRLLSEAARVARHSVLIKDHLSESGFDHATLRFMDWVGNAPHGVVLPYNYADRATWDLWFDEAGLALESATQDIPLYPAPMSWMFGRGLHFVARLTPAS